MGTPATAAATADKLERVWAALSSAHRNALLGHDHDALTVADKIRLAAISRRVSQQADRRGRTRTHRTPAEDEKGGVSGDRNNRGAAQRLL